MEVRDDQTAAARALPTTPYVYLLLRWTAKRDLKPIYRTNFIVDFINLIAESIKTKSGKTKVIEVASVVLNGQPVEYKTSQAFVIRYAKYYDVYVEIAKTRQNIGDYVEIVYRAPVDTVNPNCICDPNLSCPCSYDVWTVFLTNGYQPGRQLFTSQKGDFVVQMTNPLNFTGSNYIPGRLVLDITNQWFNSLVSIDIILTNVSALVEELVPSGWTLEGPTLKFRGDFPGKSQQLLILGGTIGTGGPGGQYSFSASFGCTGTAIPIPFAW